MCRRQRSGGTEGSNPVPSSGESGANLHFAIRRRKFTKRDGEARAGFCRQQMRAAKGNPWHQP
jgi:hypothetical protein